MRFAALFAVAALAAANPMPELASSKSDVSPRTDILWTLSYYEGERCLGEPDIEMVSKTPNSRCIKYNNGLGNELESITFRHPRGDANCKYGCDKCKIHVYYSPMGERADCCDKHKVPRDWSQDDVGKCIDISPPHNHRVRYMVDCK